MHKPQSTDAKDCRVKVDDRRYMCVNHFDCVIGYTCMCVCFRRTGPGERCRFVRCMQVICRLVSERLPRRAPLEAPLRGPCRGVRVCVLAERALKLERTVFNVLLVYTGVNAICSDCTCVTTRVGRGSPPQVTQNGCGCTSSSVRAAGRRDVSTS